MGAEVMVTLLRQIAVLLVFCLSARSAVGAQQLELHPHVSFGPGGGILFTMAGGLRWQVLWENGGVYAALHERAMVSACNEGSDCLRTQAALGLTRVTSDRLGYLQGGVGLMKGGGTVPFLEGEVGLRGRRTGRLGFLVGLRGVAFFREESDFADVWVLELVLGPRISLGGR
jgi:hypothetical protein